MTQILKCTVDKLGYNTGDTVVVASDEHLWSDDDLALCTKETGLTLSASDIAKLKMSDVALVNHAAISKLPTFRSLSTKQNALKQLHRKKYQYNNGVVLKSNAQVQG